MTGICASRISICVYTLLIFRGVAFYHHSFRQQVTNEWSNTRVGHTQIYILYRGADKSLARPTSRCILFDGENISFDAGVVIYTNSTNIPQIMIINRIYENQNLLLL